MAGVYCGNCKSDMLLEQDGKSCSNCGAVLVTPTKDHKPKRKDAPQPEPPEAPPDDAQDGDENADGEPSLLQRLTGKQKE